MAKKKLIHFTENLTFSHLFQPRYQELVPHYRMWSNWKRDFFGNDRPIILELGCGKGEYTVDLARKYPESNFIGIDIKGARLWRGSKTVAEEGLSNVAFIRTHVKNLPRLFAPEEISEIWITFPDPQPKHERRRLTAPVFLDCYRQVLPPGGIIHLKTDDIPLYLYTLGILEQQGLKVHWKTEDLYRSGTDHDVATVQTYYEQIWLAEGKPICYVRFSI